jgi:hypothetical protein
VKNVVVSTAMHAPPPPGAFAPEELPHQVPLVAEK